MNSKTPHNANSAQQAENVVPSRGERADLFHKRIMYRLRIAKWAILLGVVGIILLSILQLSMVSMTDGPKAELIRTALSALASITTLALGYIAGSNIESSGRE